MYRLFKNKSLQVGVFLPNAKRVEFLNHVYVTDRKDEIDALEQYAKSKECGVYFDAEDTEVSEESLAEIRAGMTPVRRGQRNAAVTPGVGSAASVTKTGFQEGVANTRTVISGQENAPTVTVSGDKTNAESVRKVLGKK